MGRIWQVYLDWFSIENFYFENEKKKKKKGELAFKYRCGTQS